MTGRWNREGNADPRSILWRAGPMGHGMSFKIEEAVHARLVLTRLFGYLRRHGFRLSGIIFFVVLGVLFGVLGPFLMGRAIDMFIYRGDLTGLARILAMMVGVYVLLSISAWWQEYLAVNLAQRVVRDIRNDLFSALQKLPLRFFDQHLPGEIMSRLANDTENINTMLAMSATSLIRGVLSLISVTAMMFAINGRLALMSLITLPLTALLTRWLSHHTRQGFRTQQSNLGALNALIEETISGQRVVKAYGREETAISSFDLVNGRLRLSSTLAQIYAGLAGPLINAVNNIGWTVVVASGGWLAVEGLATVGTIAAFISYTEQFTRPLNQLAQLYSNMQSALAGAERVFDLMREPPDPPDKPDARRLDRVNGEVVFEDVWFGYERDMPVLKQINLRAAPGEIVALVGPTGAGKTTIANLLTRFYDVDKGAIRLDGVDIRDLERDNLRRKLGLVLQDNFLFADTVMANIRYGRLGATDNEVIAAARFANADHFIHCLPHGYHTVLAERGENLSRGQRQLMAIARAILADPEILVLDEATSNVDSRTEKHLQEALMRLMHGRTSFIIAHRLSTIRNAHQILVINNGEIIERGTPAALLNRGVYHNVSRQ